MGDDLFDDIDKPINDRRERFNDDFYGALENPMDSKSDLLKELTNFDKYIRDLITGWLGIYWDAEYGKYKRNPQSKPMMNQRCAVWCISFLRTYARENNIITNIGRKEYEDIITDIIDVVWLNIGTRYVEFGIESTGDVLRICTEMQHAAELVLMGAGDGKYTKFLGGGSGVYQSHDNPALRPEQKGIKKAYSNIKSMFLGMNQ